MGTKIQTFGRKYCLIHWRWRQYLLRIVGTCVLYTIS